MKTLYVEIFEEPVSVEILYRMLLDLPPLERQRSEWVMSYKTFKRIATMKDSSGIPFFFPQLFGDAFTLFGRPIVIDDMEKLQLRVAS